MVELDSSIRASRMDLCKISRWRQVDGVRKINLRIENAFKRLAKGQYGLCSSAKNRLRGIDWRCFPTQSAACAAWHRLAKREDYALG